MKNNKNNGFVRNPFLYLLIIVAAVTGFQYFFAGNSIGQVSKSIIQIGKRA